MGREVRKVPEWWYHPKYFNNFRKEYIYLPLRDGYQEDLVAWEHEMQDLNRRKAEALKEGNQRIIDDIDQSQTWHLEARPDPCKYMPDFPEELRKYYQMYETCSEGTPISPKFAIPEDLARWLADNRASSFADMTATYEEWLRMITGPGWSVSAASDGVHGLISGVQAG